MAYQGKFSQPRNTEENIRLKAEARKKAEAAQKVAARPQAPAVQSIPVNKGGKRKKNIVEAFFLRKGKRE